MTKIVATGLLLQVLSSPLLADGNPTGEGGYATGLIQSYGAGNYGGFPNVIWVDVDDDLDVQGGYYTHCGANAIAFRLSDNPEQAKIYLSMLQTARATASPITVVYAVVDDFLGDVDMDGKCTIEWMLIGN